MVAEKGRKMSHRSDVQLFVKLLSEKATLPTRGSEEAAGLDLYAATAVTIAPGGKALVPTDISVNIPPGHYGRVAPRSGLAWKKHIDVGAGVIDRDYSGNISVVLYNHSPDTVFEVAIGDRIAQLILEKISMASVVEVAELSSAALNVPGARGARGEGGFGSTGK